MSSVTDGQTDGQRESDAYEPTLQYAQNKGRDTLTPLPFVVMWGMFWQRGSASYFVADEQNVYSGPHVYEI